ncbi:MAG: hypothetical protein A2451_10355 [Bdellovibrionales bacterium RIFOXYC2_FULL_39_8]|nr:MAG: hypothetical protein A2451_10355 [Bdellovibrionales bacterium RIFOXYC2_FULL_39_8]
MKKQSSLLRESSTLKSSWPCGGKLVELFGVSVVHILEIKIIDNVIKTILKFIVKFYESTTNNF